MTLAQLRASLKAAGYRRHEPDARFYKYAKDLYQKRVEEGNTTLYFINAYTYAPIPRYGKDSAAIVAEVTLYYSDEHSVMLKWSEVSIADVERYAAEAYERLGVIPDVYNQR